MNAGGRADYFEYIDQGLTISPRFGISYKIFPNTSLNASAGIFYQAPSQIILAINENNKNLNNIRVNQYIIGVEHFLNSELLFNIEAYVKQYSDYPVSISDPYSVFINYGTLFGTSYLTEAISAGSGVFRGLDISLIKKSGSYGLFGSLAISLSSSDFHTAIPVTFPLNFDYGKQMTLVAGYQFYNDWTVGIRMKAAGGKPYTPFNESESRKFRLGLYDMNKFYSERLPSYQNVDLRIDKKIYFNSVTFSAYLEIQNLLNRQNVYDYSWSYWHNLQEVNYNWEILPIIGMNVKF